MDVSITKKTKLSPEKFEDCKVMALHCLSRSLEKMLCDEWDRVIAAMCAVGEPDDTFPLTVTINLVPRAESIQTGCSMKYKATCEANGDSAVVRYDGTEVRKPVEPDLFDGTHVGGEVLIDEAKALILKMKRASLSLLQRHLKVDRDKALAIMARLEDDGFVTAASDKGERGIPSIAGEG